MTTKQTDNAVGPLNEAGERWDDDYGLDTRAAPAPSVAQDEARPEGWRYVHEHHADLIRSDGLMCGQHPGLEFDHDGCAGPGMCWIIEGKEAITTALSAQREAGYREGLEAAAKVAETRWATLSVGKVAAHLQPEVERNAIAASIRALPPYGSSDELPAAGKE